MPRYIPGLVGAGGGFLIIPALVLFSKLPMKQAVGTSLLIIAAKSLIGFLGDLSHYQMDWKLLFITTFLAVVGIFAGNLLSHKIHGNKLKKAFGWFVLTNRNGRHSYHCYFIQCYFRNMDIWVIER